MEAKKEWAVVCLDADDGTALEHPTLMDVITAVKSLDGGSNSCMGIVGSDNSILTIGGGLGKYHIQVNLADDKVCVLRDPRKPQHDINIIIASIKTSLPANLIVDEQMTIVAVQEYFAHGMLAPSLDWVDS